MLVSGFNCLLILIGRFADDDAVGCGDMIPNKNVANGCHDAMDDRRQSKERIICSLFEAFLFSFFAFCTAATSLQRLCQLTIVRLLSLSQLSPKIEESWLTVASS